MRASRLLDQPCEDIFPSVSKHIDQLSSSDLTARLSVWVTQTNFAADVKLRLWNLSRFLDWYADSIVIADWGVVASEFGRVHLNFLHHRNRSPFTRLHPRSRVARRASFWTRFEHPFASFYGRCSKSMIFLCSFWWCVTFGPLFGPRNCFLLLRVFKKGGPKRVRTDERTNVRTDVTNGLTEYFWGLYTIALRAIILPNTSLK